MAKKLDLMDLKQIITLHLNGCSNREIGNTLGVSRNTVNQYITQFKSTEIPLNELLELEEGDLRELFTQRTTIDNYRFDELMQYFEGMKKETYRVGFTFLYHYKTYSASVSKPYSYTQFMEHYNRRYQKVKGSMKLEHKAGNELMIDYAGKKLYVTDKDTGEMIPVEIFVGILPCSQYTYVEASYSQQRADLLTSIANALQYYGGVPRAIVSDNLKAAVTRASKFEPQINKSLKDFAQHYNCVINPTRTYSPQDKALVEHAVNLVYQRIYYPLREMVFFSIEDINTRIKLLLKPYNDLLFQRKEASRLELFQSIERSELKALPSTPYELKDYTRAKVQKMGYAYCSIDKNYYSVPYRFIGQFTQLSVSNSLVEVYHNHTRIATHSRNKTAGNYITVKEHLCSAHQAYSSWSPEYFKEQAKKHGISVMMVVEHIINKAIYPEIAYKRVMGIIQLHKDYSSERLNNACERALYGEALSYNYIKNILKNNLDTEMLDIDNLKEVKSHIPKHENIHKENTYN